MDEKMNTTLPRTIDWRSKVQNFIETTRAELLNNNLSKDRLLELQEQIRQEQIPYLAKIFYEFEDEAVVAPLEAGLLLLAEIINIRLDKKHPSTNDSLINREICIDYYSNYKCTI